MKPLKIGTGLGDYTVLRHLGFDKGNGEQMDVLLLKSPMGKFGVYENELSDGAHSVVSGKKTEAEVMEDFEESVRCATEDFGEPTIFKGPGKRRNLSTGDKIYSTVKSGEIVTLTILGDGDELGTYRVEWDDGIATKTGVFDDREDVGILHEDVPLHTKIRQQEKPTATPPEGYEWASEVVDTGSSDFRNFEKEWSLKPTKEKLADAANAQEREADEWLSENAEPIDDDPRDSGIDGTIENTSIQGVKALRTRQGTYYVVRRNKKYCWFKGNG